MNLEELQSNLEVVINGVTAALRLSKSDLSSSSKFHMWIMVKGAISSLELVKKQLELEIPAEYIKEVEERK